MAKFYLDWNLLLEDKCPSCGEDWKLEGDYYVCNNHEKGFKIGAFKVAKIKRDLKQREEMRPQSFSE